MDLEKEDELLIAELDDKRIKAEYRECVTHSGFLDPRQKSVAHRVFGCRFWGGYEDAERCVALFFPDPGPEAGEPLFKSDEDDPLTVLRVSVPKGGRTLSHRDYLGAMLSLGIDRGVTGDILVYEGGADIVILKTIAEYLLSSFDKAGRTSLKCELVPCSAINPGSVTVAEKRDSVASLRLDNLVSSAFDLARGKAQDAIRMGLVFVDGLQNTKQDAFLEEGAKLVLRGRGKAVLRSVGSPNRKSRLPVVWDKYI